MKDLKWNWAYYPYLDPPEKQKESAQKAGYVKVVNKSDADKVIAELEEKLDGMKWSRDEWARAANDKEKQIAELKDENRKLKRALWLARAERARDNSILLPSKFMRNVWDNVERKCRAKAKEYE